MGLLVYNEGKHQKPTHNYVDNYSTLIIDILILHPITHISQNHYVVCIVIANVVIKLAEGNMAINRVGCSVILTKNKTYLRWRSKAR